MAEILTENTSASLEILRAHTGVSCEPSPDSIAELQRADVVLMSGQFVGAGKSTFIQALEQDGRVNIPSYTNRDLRPGETEGIDKFKRPLDVMAEKMLAGDFLECEEVRPGIFYATPREFIPGKRYVKDLELDGAMRLRSFAPETPIIVPLPPLGKAPEKQVTEWERRVVLREGLYKAVNDKALGDLEGRLNGVVKEAPHVIHLDLLNDPNTLVIVNDNLPQTIEAMNVFLKTGEKLDQAGLEKHLKNLRQIAATALSIL